MTDDRTARVTGAVRQGWHSLGGGDAATCPGCPVCALADRVDHLDPAATGHLQAAGAHLLAAGRELLAVLGGGTAPGDAHVTGSPVPTAAGPSDPDDASAPTWTAVPVVTHDDREQA